MRGLLVKKKRSAALFLVFTACFGILAGRLFYLQVIRASWLQEKALEQRFHEVPVEAQRGKILDRHGRLLAASVHADCVGAVPAEVRDPRATARILASILKMNPIEIETRLRQRQAFVWIKRRLTSEEARAIRARRLPGILIEPKPQRFYPAGDLAASLLGFAGSDNQGLEGLEVYYEPYLRGRPGWDMAEFSALGRHIPGGERHYQPPVDGDTLVLTIDEGIQFIAERELETAVTETGAKRGLVIVMEATGASAGEILAMATFPRVDPGNFLAFPQETWKNFCVTDQFEPGSTFKIVTAAAALEENLVKPESTFFDPGYLLVEDRRLHCWYPGGHGSQTFVEAMENSCNPVFASLALALGAARFRRYIEAFGFGAKTGIDFPGEATGSVPKLGEAKRVELATMGFGQGVSVTPIQLVAAMAAIVNDGFLVRPRLLKELRDPQGRVIRRGEKVVVRQVISRQTSATMRMLLESVVVNGSGNRAAVPGYRVGGKTGTAQKPARGGYGSEVVASFLGFGPADHPRLVCLVMLDEPSCGIRYGGVIAAPVFARIMGSALRSLGIPPARRPEPDSDSEKVKAPNLLNLPVTEAETLLARAGLKGRRVGEGEIVLGQAPMGGTEVEPGSTVWLYLDPTAKYNNLDEGLVVVPDLTGLAPPEAEKLLFSLGLKLKALGDGVACTQEPKPGKQVRPGTPITVRFAPPAEDAGDR
ncbi:MAG: penicillin-binding transpeptidase domain-containing protein [Bacillota bacterium]